MPREIRSPEDITLQVASSNPNTYQDRLVKLIPSEIVTAYVTLQGLITTQQNNQRLSMAIVFICLLILTPFYLRSVGNVKKIGQLIFTTIAFIIWVMASGGFKIIFPDVFADNFLGSILLILYTLAIPIFYKG